MKVIPGIDKGHGIIAGAILSVGTMCFFIKAFTSELDYGWEINEDEQIVDDEPMFSSRKKKRKR